MTVLCFPGLPSLVKLHVHSVQERLSLKDLQVDAGDYSLCILTQI